MSQTRERPGDQPGALTEDHQAGGGSAFPIVPDAEVLGLTSDWRFRCGYLSGFTAGLERGRDLVSR